MKKWFVSFSPVIHGLESDKIRNFVGHFWKASEIADLIPSNKSMGIVLGQEYPQKTIFVSGTSS